MLKEKLKLKPALPISVGAGLCFGAVFGAGFGMIAFLHIIYPPVNDGFILPQTALLRLDVSQKNRKRAIDNSMLK